MPAPIGRETGVLRGLRLSLVVLLGWWTLRLSFSPSPRCFMDLVNLAFHEAGHLFFTPFGSTLHILGGTLGQLLVPALLCGYFLTRQRQPFSAAVCAWWFGENFINIAVYMADARDLRLPLVGGGDHDWNELFFRFGLLGEDSVAAISGLTRGAGIALMLAGLGWAALFILPGRVREAAREALGRRLPALGLLLDGGE